MLAPSMEDLRFRIEDRLNKGEAEPFLLGCLDKLKQSKRLVRFLHQYILFNSVFAGAIAHLVGKIHIRQDLFRDVDEPVLACSDRSADIAAFVFAAAETKYGHRQNEKVHRVAQRRLSQYFLNATLDYFQIPAETFNKEFPVTTALQKSMQAVMDGYSMVPNVGSAHLLKALGFHFASEWWAELEFSALHKFLTEYYSDLSDHLKEVTTPSNIGVFSWVTTHANTTEIYTHTALTAIEQTMQFYQGRFSREQLKEYILEGIDDFKAIQRHFFENAVGKQN